MSLDFLAQNLIFEICYTEYVQMYSFLFSRKIKAVNPVSESNVCKICNTIFTVLLDNYESIHCSFSQQIPADCVLRGAKILSLKAKLNNQTKVMFIIKANILTEVRFIMALNIAKTKLPIAEED